MAQRDSFFPAGRICVSSTSGGGGKTMLSLGLGCALAKKGFLVKPFKKGPDYIDAAWLGKACGMAATNLDPFFLSLPELRALFVRTMAGLRLAGAEKPPWQGLLALIEGNRGLYDGLDAAGSCSTAAVARALACPVLLCIDCAKATRTVAAILQGLLAFEADISFCGVVLNRIGSSRHESALRQAISTYTGLPVLGALPRLKENLLPERHMGLASRGAELSDMASGIFARLADFVSASIDLDAVAQAAMAARPLPGGEDAAPCENAAIFSGLAPSLAWGPLPEEKARPGWNNDLAHALLEESCSGWHAGNRASFRQTGEKPRIGYVCDDVLWFYYPENLLALQNAGVSLVRLSLLDSGGQNVMNWQDLDGLYLGGGFPEDFAAAISQSPCLGAISAMARSGMPVYAECGGLLLLCSSLECGGETWPMSGVFAAVAQWLPHPQGLGYVQARVIGRNPFFPIGLRFRGHEFHYSHCLWPDGKPEFALELELGRGLSGPGRGRPAYDGLARGNVWGAYTHIFAPAVPCWAPNFAAAARAFHS